MENGRYQGGFSLDRLTKTLRNINTYRRVAGFGGPILAMKGRMMNSDALVNVQREEIKFPFSLRIPSSDVHTCAQIFLYHEYDFLVKTPPNVIVDAGANIGLASIYFANRYPTATIISIEPEEENFTLLKGNVKPYRNIIPLQAALWKSNGTIDLVDPGVGAWGFMTQEIDSVGKTSGKFCHTVKAITLSKILDDYQFDKIDILKIDIEGAEKEVFEDTTAWIAKVRALIIELHEGKKPGCNRSFYNGSRGFDDEWKQGENLYLTRDSYLTKRPSISSGISSRLLSVRRGVL